VTLCALIVVLVFEGLQNDGIASERTFATEIEAMNLVVSENIIVIQPSKEPQTDGIATHRSNLRNKWGSDRAVVSNLRRVACPDHIFGKIFSGEKEGRRIDWVRDYHLIDDQLSDYSWGFPIIFESIGDADIVPAGNAPVFNSFRNLNEFDDLREIVFIDNNKKACALHGDGSVGGTASGLRRDQSGVNRISGNGNLSFASEPKLVSRLSQTTSEIDKPAGNENQQKGEPAN
jgi:hypothetical protein